MIDHDATMRREHKRQKTVEEAVRQADRIIMDASDGTVENTKYLTSALALQLLSNAVGLVGEVDSSVASVHLAEKTACAVIGRDCVEPEVVRADLLMRVAKRFVEKVAIPYSSRLMRHDIENPAKAEEC